MISNLFSDLGENRHWNIFLKIFMTLLFIKKWQPASKNIVEKRIFENKEKCFCFPKPKFFVFFCNMTSIKNWITLFYILILILLIKVKSIKLYSQNVPKQKEKIKIKCK